MRVNNGFNIPRLEHIAVWSESIPETESFLEDVLGWKRHPVVFGVSEDNSVFGGMELAFVDANGLWLELVQPTTEGPGMDFLREKGNGSLVELDFEIDDFDKNVDEMKARGVDLIGMDGEPLQGGGYLHEWVEVDGRIEQGDERLSYLPFELARGTSIELFWEDPETGVVVRRDRDLRPEYKSPASSPRLDSVVVIGEDLEKLAAVYTEILRLERIDVPEGLARPWMALGNSSHAWINGNSDSIWIELIAPTSSNGQAGVLGTHGEGTILELLAEVDSIDDFHDQMSRKGIRMTAGDGVPLPDGEKAVLNAGSGDRFCYFPLEVSKGMRIMIFERGPAETSVFSKRDAAG